MASRPTRMMGKNIKKNFSKQSERVEFTGLFPVVYDGRFQWINRG